MDDMFNIPCVQLLADKESKKHCKLYSGTGHSPADIRLSMHFKLKNDASRDNANGPATH